MNQGSDFQKVDSVKDKVQKILDSIEAFLFLIDPSTGALVYVNELAQRRLGICAKSSFNTTLKDICASISTDVQWLKYSKNTRDHKLTTLDNTFLKHDRVKIPVKLSIRNFDQEESDYFIVEAHDISEKQRLIKEKKEIEERILVKDNAIREMLSQLKQEKERCIENLRNNIQLRIMPVLKKGQVQETGITPELSKKMIGAFQELLAPFGTSLQSVSDKLSPKELEICGMIRNGYSAKEIAHLLNTSIRTIDTHRNNIRKKLNLTSRKINLTIYLKNM